MLTDTYLQYTKDVSTYFNKRWAQLAGSKSFAGQDTFNNADASIAAQISRLRSAASNADFVVVSSLPPGGASAIRQIRGAGINLPILAAAAFDGSYWLSAVPKLSNFYYPALGSLYGDDPNPARAKLLYKDFKKVSGKAPTLASYPLLGYAAVQSLVRGMKMFTGGLHKRQRRHEGAQLVQEHPVDHGCDHLHGEVPHPERPPVLDDAGPRKASPPTQA